MDTQDSVTRPRAQARDRLEELPDAAAGSSGETVGRKAACLGQRQCHLLKLPTQQAGDMKGSYLTLKR